VTKVTCELRALEPGPESAGADGGPAGAASTKCCGLSAGEANAGTVLIEESAATLTQFLLAGLVLQSSKEWPAGEPGDTGGAQIRREGDRMST
jgi:hypothetical protein